MSFRSFFLIPLSAATLLGGEHHALAQTLCDAPEVSCGRLVPPACLSKLGAGAAPLAAGDCEGALKTYGECLATIAQLCPQARASAEVGTVDGAPAAESAIGNQAAYWTDGVFEIALRSPAGKEDRVFTLEAGFTDGALGYKVTENRFRIADIIAEVEIGRTDPLAFILILRERHGFAWNNMSFQLPVEEIEAIAAVSEGTSFTTLGRWVMRKLPQN